MLRQLLALAQDAAPPVCILCDTEHDSGGWLCGPCDTNIIPNKRPCHRCGLPRAAPLCADCRRRPPPFALTCAPLCYAGSMRGLIQRWKFQQEPALTALLVRHALPHWPAPHIEPDLLVPIPSHWRRRWVRGFDQTWLLANSLRHHCGLSVPVRPMLTRHRATTPQSRLPVHVRARNVVDAFSASNVCAGADIALVDDVMTTGATAESASRTLLAAGARSVQVWCLARVDTPADRL